MPDVPGLDATSQAIRRTFQAAQDRLDAEQARIIAEWPTMPRTARLARLRELQATVDELMAAADQLALRWAQRGLPEAYTLGATTAASAAAGTSPVFTQVAVDALNLVVQDTFEDLLSATTHVRSTAKDQIRYLAKDRIADRLIRGTTPAQAAKELAQDLASKGITAVTYKDGSTRTLADYTDMLIRTRTAEVHQIGGFDQADAFGIKYMEIFDGASCGWTSHQDPNPANGKIVTVEEARAYPVSHPRCRRSSSPRPDITTKAQAKKAQPSTTAAQRADQSAAEARHAAGVERRRLARNNVLTDRGSRAESPAARRHASRMATTGDSAYPRVRGNNPAGTRGLPPTPGGDPFGPSAALGVVRYSGGPTHRRVDRSGHRDGDRVRLLNGLDVPVVATFKPLPRVQELLEQVGVRSVEVHELDVSAAAVFREQLAKVRVSNAYAASVAVYDEADYATMRLFLSETGESGFALKGDDLISVFSYGSGTGTGDSLVMAAIVAGARTLDAFDTVLPRFYGDHGFKGVARLLWDDDYAPDGWDKDLFARFNNGSPDVVFMGYNPRYFAGYQAGQGARVSDYDEGQRLAREYVAGSE